MTPDFTDLYNDRISMLIPLFVGLSFITVSCILITTASLRHRGRHTTRDSALVVPPVERAAERKDFVPHRAIR